MGQIQTLRRADRTAGSTVACLQRGFHIIRGQRPRPDTFQRTHKAAHLIVQEGPRTNIKVDFQPAGRFDFADIQTIQ